MRYIFDLSTTINKSVPNHAAKYHFCTKNKILTTAQSRTRQHENSERKLARTIFFPRHFQTGFSKSIRTISKGFQSVSTF